MLKPEQVPDEAADAVLHCFHTRSAAKAAIAAAINAWPGMEIEMVGEDDNFLILPLSHEAGDVEGP